MPQFNPFRRSKYRAKRAVIDGHTFASQKEAAAYMRLRDLEAKGQILSLELQPRFELMSKFVYRGEKIRSLSYVADFRYKLAGTGETVVVDVKGFRTPEYLIKRKLFLHHIAIPQGISFVEY
jgi:hypothetical protein